MRYKKGSKIGTATIIGDSAASRVANVERVAGCKPLEAKEDQRFDSPVGITVTSYRKRLCDADGVSFKAALDGLVHCGVLQDDSTEFVKEIRYKQVKVNSSTEEKTVIEIQAIDD